MQFVNNFTSSAVKHGIILHFVRFCPTNSIEIDYISEVSEEQPQSFKLQNILICYDNARCSENTERYWR